MDRSGNAAACIAPLSQQQQQHQQQQQEQLEQCNDRRDRRAQSLESQRKRDRVAADSDSAADSRSAKLAKPAGASGAPHACASSPHPRSSAPGSAFASSAASPSSTTEIFGTPTGRLEDYFTMESVVLGSGQFGTVRRCVENATGTRFACKTILKSRLTTESDRHEVRREVVLMQRLSPSAASACASSGASPAGQCSTGGHSPPRHPPHHAAARGVVQLRAVFEDEVAVHLVMELCDGGELFDEIARRGRLSERDAAQVFHPKIPGPEKMPQEPPPDTRGTPRRGLPIGFRL